MVKVSPRRGDVEEPLTAQPGYALVGVLRIPEAQVSPLRAIGRRVAIALLALLAAVITVYLGRGGYTDVRGGPLTFLDCVYFATVSLTTVGYGDITPHTHQGRLIATLVMLTVIPLFAATFSLLTTSLTAIHVSKLHAEAMAHIHHLKEHLGVDHELPDHLVPAHARSRGRGASSEARR